MNRIELLGASGVGKTTLYQRLDALAPKQRPYMTLREAYRLAALSRDVSPRNGRLFLYQLLLKSGIAQRKERGLGCIVLKALAQGTDRRHRYNQFQVSFNILYQSLQDSEGPYFTERSIQRFLSSVEEYLLLEESLPGQATVLVDEGMLHRHPGITNYARETFSEQQLLADPALNPAGIVHCVQTPENVTRQAQKRKADSVQTFTHGPLDSIELKELVHRNIANVDRRVARFRAMGVPVLVVNTGDDSREIFSDIGEFILSLKAKASTSLGSPETVN